MRRIWAERYSVITTKTLLVTMKKAGEKAGLVNGNNWSFLSNFCEFSLQVEFSLIFKVDNS